MLLGTFKGIFYYKSVSTSILNIVCLIINTFLRISDSKHPQMDKQVDSLTVT